MRHGVLVGWSVGWLLSAVACSPASTPGVRVVDEEYPDGGGTARSSSGGASSFTATSGASRPVSSSAQGSSADSRVVTSSGSRPTGPSSGVRPSSSSGQRPSSSSRTPSSSLTNASSAPFSACTVGGDDCPLGSFCVSSFLGVGVCISGCERDANCPDGLTCSQGQCLVSCAGTGACPNGLTCMEGVCTEGCSNNQDCPPGTYCSMTDNGQPNQCLPGCTSNDACVGSADICDTDNRTCVECLVEADCTLPIGITGVCEPTTHTCQFACQPDSPNIVCRAQGLFCDEETLLCAECNEEERCNGFEQCVSGRCVGENNRPLCAPCETDDECGGALDLCVTQSINGRQERACGTDCSQGQACPSGTACIQVGGNGTPVRGRQCFPSNSVGPATCSARRDLTDYVECDRGSDCGLLGGTPSPDAICSGAGTSEGQCSIFCSMDGADCPDGFWCEDPPDTPEREFLPRCGVLAP